ncbi:TetR family transcriptional regulator [Glutamicibacter sp. NPDC087344]|uniref:TetR family transcriptional regulator n=1 Tax=Glutamicibacter sp. NPDC087344 TaxID=3363994 RepID=UPI0037F7D5FE
MTSLSVGNRREKNKQATLQAIVAAAADLLHEGHGASITATQIADAAGISRRTLFNYFPTVDAILSYPLHTVLETMVESINEFPDSIPLIEAIVLALKSDEVSKLLGQVALFGAYLKADSPNGCYPTNMAEWQIATTDVIERVARRYPQADNFSIRVFTHAILGAGQAAFDEWIDRLPHPHGAPLELSNELIAEFHHLITQAMKTLNEGFTALPTTALPIQED